MLTKIEITNFKIFEKKTIVPLSNLNVFTGINGRGKSTTLQALILMKQSIEGEEVNEIKLLGKYLELGTFGDIKNVENEVEFEFFENSNSKKYSFNSNHPTSINIKTGIESKGEKLTLDFNKIHFVSAERIGPKTYYNRLANETFSSVGKNGEFVASILFDKQDENVPDILLANKEEAKTLIEQTSGWLSIIFKGSKVKIGEQLDTILSLSYKCQNSVKYSKPTNVGFGFSNVLPIIVAGLIAKSGDILIVDSPEAHLHPSAQSEIAKFLAKVSLNGVQVFIETHSEHILNGIRISIKDESIDIKPSNTSILYFQGNVENPIISIVIDNEGKISNWPKGFFDQSLIDEEYLLWN